MSNATSVITSMQSALNCASKCDCCANLQSQINTINAKIAGLKVLTEAEVRKIVDDKLTPKVNEIEYKLLGAEKDASTALKTANTASKTANDAIFQAIANTNRIRLAEIEAKGASESATRAEKNAAEYARQMREEQARLTRVEGEQNRLDRVNKQLELSDTELRELERKNAREAERLAQIERKNSPRLDSIEREIPPIRDTANSAKTVATNAAEDINGVRTTANSALSKAEGALLNAAEAGKNALNEVADVTGLKGLVNGISESVNAFGKTVAAIEAKAGEALISAAKAVGISEQALAATGRLLGKIAEIFNIIGTFATLIEQLTTLNILGGRIDAVEAAVEALGASVSGILGKLLGLQNRIGRNEVSIGEVRIIAVDAKSVGDAAILKANTALSRARDASTTAFQAQTTADGAVRNAATANENATTAYKKANEAQGIGEQAKRIAGDALGKAGTALTTALTAITLYQLVKGLRGLPGIPGVKGDKGDKGDTGKNGITTVVQIPGTPGQKGDKGDPGRQGVPGIPGRNGKDGKDVNPADVAGLRALIVQQHAATRANINSTSQGLVAGVKGFFTTQLAGITALITAIANNTYIEKALAVMTFAATIHNALMLSNNLAQTLGTIIDQVLGFILPKGLDGNPISISNVLGKAAHEIIADTIGEANYTQITEDWAKANRIYQAGVNVFNQIGNAVGLVTAGMEVIGGNVAKIGNALKIWGVIGEKAYSWMNPQPNLKGKFFNFVNTASDKANTIMMMVAVPIGISVAASEINSSIGAVKKELDQEDPKDKDGNPITDKLGNPLKWEPGVTVPDPTKTVLAQEQAKADSKNIIAATLEDIFDGSD